jgi:hypothetical protein
MSDRTVIRVEKLVKTYQLGKVSIPAFKASRLSITRALQQR